MPYCLNEPGMIRNLILSLMLCTATVAKAQDTIAFSLRQSYTFLQEDANIIHNSVTLSEFYEKLYQLKKVKKNNVNILQIGDSHIQADFLSGAVRKLLQLEFGNAGRGLIFPGRVGRTNESGTVYSSSTGLWDAKRIIYTNQPMPIGIGGMTVQTQQAGNSISIKANANELNYSFNKITFFFEKDLSSFNLAVKDSTGQNIAYVGPYTFENPNISRVLLPYSISQAEFQTMQSTHLQKQFTLYGINLENSKPGVLYHSTGGNGAKVKHYIEASLFAEQTAALTPDLIIISLGTNEAIEYPYVDPRFQDQLDTFVNQLKQHNPQTKIILTVPMDFYKKKTRRNPGVEVMRGKLMEYADANGLAFWDLYSVAGGKHAADQWKSSSLLQSDGVHFTKNGYELQGSLLYQALIKGYNEYVRYRYP
jgi:lysophospholipase L1-like esterase